MGFQQSKICFEFVELKDGLKIHSNCRYGGNGFNLLFCVHGNSSNNQTFEKIIKEVDEQELPLNVVAIDLPGCGKSSRLDEYSMTIVGDIVSKTIEHYVEKFNSKSVIYFGHSLGGHFQAFINYPIDEVIIAGTPPLSSSEDFPHAFDPNEENKELIPLLTKPTQFTLEEATKFVVHTGVKEQTLEDMIDSAYNTDGKFRECLKSVADKNQKSDLEKRKNVVIIHAHDDGVISAKYLETLDKKCLFKNEIQYIDGKHMSPWLQSNKIISIIKVAFLKI